MEQVQGAVAVEGLDAVIPFESKVKGTRIKELKLRNFKSFKKVDIPFANGLTAIMGPNGSGKSNILDSLLFVFGVSSLRSIRAKVLTDLVHHSAADGTARVSVHLTSPNDNGVEQEYVITRSIDKQGKSFYKLDGKRVTKNKVHSLLTSLGVSTSGYNVVLQGDVESIIKMGPTQRREILDEVAGIAEYEEKKNEALKQLDEVQGKIKDWSIVKGERRGVLDSLEKDRESALKFQEYSQRMKRASFTILNSELESVLKEKAGAEAVLQKADAEVQGVEQQIRAAEAEISRLESEIRGLQEKALKVGGETHGQIASRISSVRTEIQVKESQAEEKRRLVEKHKAEIESLRAKIQELDSRIEKEENSLRPKLDRKAELESKILQLYHQQKRAMQGLEGSDSEAFKLESEIKSLAELHMKKKEEYFSLKAEYDSIVKTKELMTSESRKGGKLEALQAAVSQSATDLKEHAAKLSEFEAKKEKVYSDERHANKELQELEESLKETREKYISLKAKLNTLQGLNKNLALESLTLAAREGKIRGFHGVVSDLCKYDSKYAHAVEKAAGPKMFFIIVDDDSSAVACINHLKSTRQGSAAFIPLNKIRPPKPAAQDVLSRPGVLGSVQGFVSFDARYKAAFDYVFGDTVVIDSIERSKSVGVGSVRMVSLDGDLVESSGVMMGGARDSKKATLAEQKELESLGEKLAKQEEAKRLLMRELESIRANVNVLVDESSEVELKVRELETHKKALESQLNELKGLGKQGLTVEGKDVDTLIEEKRGEMHVISQQISNLESQKAALEKRFEERRNTRSSLNLQEVDSQLNALREEKSQLELEIRAITTGQEQGVSVLKREHEAKIASLEGESKALSSEIRDLEFKVRELHKALEVHEAELRKASKEVEEINRQKESLESKLKGEAVSRGKLDARIASIRASVTDATAKNAYLEVRVADLKRELSTYSGVERLQDAVEELKKEVLILDNKIQELGPVNMKAIEEYEVYSVKLKETEEKIEVLAKEKDAVLDLIAKIDSRRVEAFMGTYHSVKANFERMYNGITGGRGTLKLSNEAEPLSSGLILEANPEGSKNMRNIDALSGGEKTLTSMAFLFAIQRHKPAPFYVLDECDAALDMVNAEKMSDLFTAFSKESQFITITHKQALLKNAQHIVGVVKSHEGTSVIGIHLPKSEEVQRMAVA